MNTGNKYIEKCKQYMIIKKFKNEIIEQILSNLFFKTKFISKKNYLYKISKIVANK